MNIEPSTTLNNIKTIVNYWWLISAVVVTVSIICSIILKAKRKKFEQIWITTAFIIGTLFAISVVFTLANVFSLYNISLDSQQTTASSKKNVDDPHLLIADCVEEISINEAYQCKSASGFKIVYPADAKLTRTEVGGPDAISITATDLPNSYDLRVTYIGKLYKTFESYFDEYLERSDDARLNPDLKITSKQIANYKTLGLAYQEPGGEGSPTSDVQIYFVNVDEDVYEIASWQSSDDQKIRAQEKLITDEIISSIEF